MARQEFLHSLVKRAGRGHIAEGKKVVNRLRVHVELAAVVIKLRERPQLRRKLERPFSQTIEERLNSDAVPRHPQPAPTAIPEGEGKHAAKLIEAIEAVFLVEVNDGLGVADCAEMMPAGLEILT